MLKRHTAIVGDRVIFTWNSQQLNELLHATMAYVVVTSVEQPGIAMFFFKDSGPAPATAPQRSRMFSLFSQAKTVSRAQILEPGYPPG
jgi:hypothetical protein